jgi:AAA15 family ATPase/GTPase
MLLGFSASNFGSLRDKQELSLIASRAIKDDPSGLIDAPALRGERILPAAVVYGANASGKSNLVKALAHMQMLVRDSHRRGEPGEPVPLKPFLLDPQYADKPAAFSADFLWKGHRYAYAFEAQADRFLRETLYVWRDGPRTMLFERENEAFEFGRSLKGENRVTEKLTRPNSLFLSAAMQNNHEMLTEIGDFFRDLFIDKANVRTPPEVARALARRPLDKRVVHILSAIDIGAVDIKVLELRDQDTKFKVAQKNIDNSKVKTIIGKDLSSKEFAKALADQIVQNIEDELNRELLSGRRVRLERISSEGFPVYLDFDDESAGTIQILSILGPVFRVLDEGGVAVIDEFGSRLHTRASELILALFQSKETNPKGAQIVVTTHDTNLLNSQSLRRDQIWFTEKDEAGATHLYPLTDIETRKGDNLERGYLQGRYGAIPFAGSISSFKKTD